MFHIRVGKPVWGLSGLLLSEKSPYPRGEAKKGWTFRPPEPEGSIPVWESHPRIQVCCISVRRLHTRLGKPLTIVMGHSGVYPQIYAILQVHGVLGAPAGAGCSWRRRAPRETFTRAPDPWAEGRRGLSIAWRMLARSSCLVGWDLRGVEADRGGRFVHPAGLEVIRAGQGGHRNGPDADLRMIWTPVSPRARLESSSGTGSTGTLSQMTARHSRLTPDTMR